MARSLLLLTLVWFATVATFCAVHGFTEYTSARSSHPYRMIDGVEIPLTDEELRSIFLVGKTVLAIPYGIVGVSLLGVPLIFVGRSLRAVATSTAISIMIGVGAIAGGGLSFVTWILFGGWGLPFPYASVAAGALMGPLVLFVVRFKRAPNSYMATAVKSADPE